MSLFLPLSLFLLFQSTTESKPNNVVYIKGILIWRSAPLIQRTIFVRYATEQNIQKMYTVHKLMLNFETNKLLLTDEQLKTLIK